MKKLKYIAPILIAVACLGLQHAKADSMDYTLVTSNNPGTLGAGPFGTGACRSDGWCRHDHIHSPVGVSICGRGVGCCQCQRQCVDNWKF